MAINNFVPTAAPSLAHTPMGAALGAFMMGNKAMYAPQMAQQQLAAQTGTAQQQTGKGMQEMALGQVAPKLAAQQVVSATANAQLHQHMANQFSATASATRAAMMYPGFALILKHWVQEHGPDAPIPLSITLPFLENMKGSVVSNQQQNNQNPQNQNPSMVQAPNNNSNPQTNAPSAPASFMQNWRNNINGNNSAPANSQSANTAPSQPSPYTGPLLGKSGENFGGQKNDINVGNHKGAPTPYHLNSKEVNLLPVHIYKGSNPKFKNQLVHWNPKTGHQYPI